MTKQDKIKDYLDEQLYNYELVAVWNDYCAETGCGCDFIYEMGEFNDYYCGCNPSDIARAVFNSSKFNPFDEYFVIDGNGNPVSMDYPDECINTADLAEYIVESDRDFEIVGIRNILDEDENEDDSED